MLTTFTDYPHLQNVAFYSFAIFALGQMFVAIFVARSQAMVGDSSAMVVDSLTYLFNSYAEKIKNKSLQENDNDETLSDVEKEIRRLNRTRQRLWLEILPPLCSVMTLIGLTIYITVDAWDTLTSSEYNEDSEDDGTSTSTMGDEPDIGVMFFFSGLNLLLDILNVTCFARAKHAFGFAVIDQDRHRYMLAYDGSLHNRYADSLKEIRSEVDLTRLDSDEQSTRESYSSISEEHQASSQEEENNINNTQEVNLNMCSAYTVSRVEVQFDFSIDILMPAACLHCVFCINLLFRLQSMCLLIHFEVPQF